MTLAAIVVTVEMAIYMVTKGSQNALDATDPGSRPGRFPLGSAQSRAAARSLLEARRTAKGEGTLICVMAIEKPHDPDLKCTCPIPEAGTFALCYCFFRPNRERRHGPFWSASLRAGRGRTSSLSAASPDRVGTESQLVSGRKAKRGTSHVSASFLEE
jgi:hypothetical protein